MTFKFENLDVWNPSLEYADRAYEPAGKLPEKERCNLSSQIIRAATSISLNIAEGSTGQTDREQNRFSRSALRSVIDTVACQRLIARRKYAADAIFLEPIDLKAQELAIKINAFRKVPKSAEKSIQEEQAIYVTGGI
jgi:four helix bundle protein